MDRCRWTGNRPPTPAQMAKMCDLSHSEFFEVKPRPRACHLEPHEAGAIAHVRCAGASDRRRAHSSAHETADVALPLSTWPIPFFSSERDTQTMDPQGCIMFTSSKGPCRSCSLPCMRPSGPAGRRGRRCADRPSRLRTVRWMALHRNPPRHHRDTGNGDGTCAAAKSINGQALGDCRMSRGSERGSFRALHKVCQLSGGCVFPETERNAVSQ